MCVCVCVCGVKAKERKREKEASSVGRGFLPSRTANDAQASEHGESALWFNTVTQTLLARYRRQAAKLVHEHLEDLLEDAHLPGLVRGQGWIRGGRGASKGECMRKAC